MKRAALYAVILLVLAALPSSCRRAELNIGSKKFTESVILGEIVTQLAESQGIAAKHHQELGGTRIAFNSLVDGQIDVYPEYTGTITQEILSDQTIESNADLAAALAGRGVSMSGPLGFNNTYALAMLKSRAAELSVTKISDLARHPNLRFGVSNEFLDRGDGWPALAARYGFQFDIRGLDHDIAYRQLQGGSIDVMDVYSTDAKIKTMDLAVLEDDRGFFPRYDAVILYRADVAKRFPKMAEQMQRLSGALDEQSVIEMNHKTEVEHTPESVVAAEFLQSELGVTSQVSEPTLAAKIGALTLQHLDLVRRSLIPAILVGIPLGVIAAKRSRLRAVILNTVGVIQTIPSLALLVMLMPLVNRAGGQSIGVGSVTAVIALFLYSLLPIVRNTFTGVSGIAPQYSESAEAMGLSPSFRLWNIELPLATRDILSGIKTAAVINVGFATLGALIGAGGYGQPILTGIRLANTNLILQGAIPAAVLAVLVQLFFDRIEYCIVPRGLRL